MGLRAAWKALWGDNAMKASGERPVFMGRYFSRIPGQGIVGISPGAQLDYVRLAGELRDNGVVAICLRWLRQQVPQGQLKLGKFNPEDNGYETVDGHPVYAILKRPNPSWTWNATIGGLVDSLVTDGNAYLLKVRGMAGSGPVRELYWAPNDQIQVQPDPSQNPARPILHYYFRNAGAVWEPWQPEDVIHFRDGIDPKFPWMGLSTVKRQIRGIAGLNAGESYTASILRHGHAGKVLVPKESITVGFGGESPDEVALRAERDRLIRQTTGENGGRLAIATTPLETLDLGDGPEHLLLDRILDRPESLVVAATGLNTLVLNLTSSDSTRTFSNKAEASREAWEHGVIPIQDVIADSLTHQLLYWTDKNGKTVAEWGDSEDLEFFWNRQHVAALREDANERAQRTMTLFTSTVMPRNRALAEGGYDPIDDEEQGEAYYGDPSPLAREQTEEAQENTAEQQTEDAAGTEPEVEADEERDDAV